MHDQSCGPEEYHPLASSEEFAEKCKAFSNNKKTDSKVTSDTEQVYDTKPFQEMETPNSFDSKRAT